MSEDAQRALAAALLLGPLCALLGMFVTARRMAFLSDTIAHGALTGVALGIWLGFADLTIPMVLFSLGIAASIDPQDAARKARWSKIKQQLRVA